MSTAVRIPLQQAEQEAADFRALFEGCYAEWVIAGSVRRRKPDVGDVEHVVIPKFAPSSDMFDDARVDWQAHPISDRAHRLLCAGTIRLHRYGDGGSHRYGLIIQ